MKITVTLDCIICGLCTEIAPEIFRINEKNAIAEIIRNPQTTEEISQTNEAVDSCPTDAIQITD
jgi:ferredoxin